MEFSGAVTRLTDPKGVAASPRQMHELSEKISACITRLFRQPANGGNPFLFALSAPKPHELRDDIPTAATDGKKYYWNPEWLESLSPDEVATIMAHESYHILFFHCSPERAGGYDREIWNIAVDYSVNATIETDHQQSGRDRKYQLWTGPIGPAITLDAYLEWIAGTRDKAEGCFADITVFGRSPESMYDQIRKAILNSPRRCVGPVADPTLAGGGTAGTPKGMMGLPTPGGPAPGPMPSASPGTPSPGPTGGSTSSGGGGAGGTSGMGACGALSRDPKTGKSIHGPGPYPPGHCQDCGQPPNGNKYGPGSVDSHLPSSQTKDETLGDMLRAAEQTRALGRGNVPGGIEEALGLLGKPELTARDIIRCALAQKQIDKGNVNDWKRIKRRPEYIYEIDANGKFQPKYRLYMPKKHDFRANVAVMVDTSGSMSDDDIICGVKEIQTICGIADIHMTPNDTQPHWDKTLKVNTSSDFQHFRVAGRGGTDFTQYLAELPKQPWYKGVDLVVIITDGDCGEYPKSLLPQGADLLWIVTNKREFKASGGRVAQLRPSRS